MKRFSCRIAPAIITCLLLAGCGFQGHSFVRNADGSIGHMIAGVKITFAKESSDYTKSITTDENGHYKIPLRKGRYWVTATHPDYEDYSSVPGFFVVKGGGYQTGNIFLREPRVTTVLLVRHAEKEYPPRLDDRETPLNPAGEVRAEKLAHVTHKTGVTAVYATEYIRTQQTVQPLADLLEIEPIIYTDVAWLANQVLSEHNGDVVLIAGHSNTVPQIINSLGGSSILSIGNEYDNLFVVTVFQPGQAHILNLQYGVSTLPSVVRGDHPLKTVLLVHYTETGSTGVERAEQLAHVARTAGVRTIFAEEGNLSQQTVQPLADALSLQAVSYNLNDIPVITDQILLDTAGVFVIAGQKDAMSQIIHSLGGFPYPPIFANEYDNMFVLTVHKFDEAEAKLVSLQYGEPNP